MSVVDVSYKGSWMYKEFLQINKSKDNSIEKWAKDNKHFLENDIQMMNKHGKILNSNQEKTN